MSSLRELCYVKAKSAANSIILWPGTQRKGDSRMFVTDQGRQTARSVICIYSVIAEKHPATNVFKERFPALPFSDWDGFTGYLR